MEAFAFDVLLWLKNKTDSIDSVTCNTSFEKLITMDTIPQTNNNNHEFTLN